MELLAALTCTSWYMDMMYHMVHHGAKRKTPGFAKAVRRVPRRIHPRWNDRTQPRSACGTRGNQQAHADPLFWRARRDRRRSDGFAGRAPAAAVCPGGVRSGRLSGIGGIRAVETDHGFRIEGSSVAGDGSLPSRLEWLAQGQGVLRRAATAMGSVADEVSSQPAHCGGTAAALSGSRPRISDHGRCKAGQALPAEVSLQQREGARVKKNPGSGCRVPAPHSFFTATICALLF